MKTTKQSEKRTAFALFRVSLTGSGSLADARWWRALVSDSEQECRRHARAVADARQGVSWVIMSHQPRMGWLFVDASEDLQTWRTHEALHNVPCWLPVKDYWECMLCMARCLLDEPSFVQEQPKARFVQELMEHRKSSLNPSIPPDESGICDLSDEDGSRAPL